MESYDIIPSDEETSIRDVMTTASNDMTFSIIENPFRVSFEYCIITSLKKDEELESYRISTTFSYPKQDDETLESISRFCFPDSTIWKPSPPFVSENYCFVLTKETGVHQYGYCRRYMPPKSGGLRLPEVICMVSNIHAPVLYEQILKQIEESRKDSVEHTQTVIRTLHSGSTTCACPGQNGSFGENVANRSEEIFHLSRVIRSLSADNILYVFSKMLGEKRLIFTARCLSTLSTCISILVSLLYPFSWPHTYIPIMTEDMLGLCCAPTPYIVGILTAFRQKLRHPYMDKVTIVDLDNDYLDILGENGDTLLPRRYEKYISDALKDSGGADGGPRDYIIRHAFMRMFLETVGHYERYIIQLDSRLFFQKELFIKNVTSQSTREFLNWFSETQVFETFISDKLENGIPTKGLFYSYLAHRKKNQQSDCQLV